MSLRVVGAGLPRTGTASLKTALEQLLGAPCYHMRDIPEHPFDLGDSWHGALRGRLPDWDAVYDGYAAAVDWPTSLFWRELSAHYPTATVLLSVRDSAKTWWESANATMHVDCAVQLWQGLGSRGLRPRTYPVAASSFLSSILTFSRAGTMRR